MPAADPTDRFAPGDRVGPYRVQDLLGEGGVGHVYRAAHEPDGGLVALKVLKPGLSGSDEARRRFLREARAAGEVHHRHVVAIHDAGEADGRLYLAMDYIVGRSLDRRIGDDGPLGVRDLLGVIGQVAVGLDALHTAGLVHRDVKPSNIMLDEAGDAALTDLGLAKRDDYSKLTRAGQVLGTMDYMAPEILRGQEADARGDVYSLGCVAFECLSGRPPFEGSMFEVGMGHLDEAPADPCAGRDDAPPGLGDAVRLALAKDPAARPPTALTYARMISACVPLGSA